MAGAQAVSLLLPNATVRVRFQAKSYRICCGQIGSGSGLLRKVQFPLPILILPNALYSSIGKIGPLWPAYQEDSVSSQPMNWEKGI